MVTDSRTDLARAIWEASRADEGTISATGANIVADALLASGVVRLVSEERERIALALRAIGPHAEAIARRGGSR